MSFADKFLAVSNWRSDNFGKLLTQKGQLLGKPKLDFLQYLQAYPDIITFIDEHTIVCNNNLRNEQDKSAAIAFMLKDIKEKFRIFPLWRDETWRAAVNFNAQAEFLIERGCVSLFGLPSWGVYLNGYVKKHNDIYMWIATRAKTKKEWPGLLDQLAAGGQPHNLTPFENMCKEAQEEAGLTKDYWHLMKQVGSISYQYELTGLRRDTLFMFDIELSADFRPTAVDGEVESFQLMHIDEVANIVEHTERFKPNCAIVVSDFLLRHNILPKHKAQEVIELKNYLAEQYSL